MCFKNEDKELGLGSTKENMFDYETGRNKERIVYLETCRIIAVFCIMYQHTGGEQKRGCIPEAPGCM